LKKKLQNDKEKRKKRGNVRKIEKKDAKRCTKYSVFSKSGNNPAPRQSREGRLRRGLLGQAPRRL